MATEGKERRCWIIVHRQDLEDDDKVTEVDENQPPVAVLFSIMDSSAEVKRAFRKASNVDNEQLIIKLRNKRGSVIPINGFVAPNTKHMPYEVQVVRRHQHVKPKPRSVKLPGYNVALKDRLENMTKRIEALECYLPELRNKRQDKIDKEVTEINEKMKFLNKRMSEAERLQWKGMFKRHPLW
ncbi:uncharacterized protein LOC117113462 isoform X2 [Anneissia japonica]|uniref:uncharacterized protein LOC117113462 isoform X1 n=1 Tax=Anneissia japonica TaxID=1529436 RepID=UPI0014259B06|nr:uncharacterized protein LOC117113462 isoform X1 [Anneissia japonica]XP_033112686.1 uncharacterized protein LOC117113462 isoform X2 [Anneissia japonica]